MAKELNITFSVSFSKNSVALPSESRTFQIDVAGANAFQNSQTITSAADVQVQIPASIASIGYLIVYNIGSTAVQFSYATGGSFTSRWEVKAGGFAVIPSPTS